MTRPGSDRGAGKTGEFLPPPLLLSPGPQRTGRGPPPPRGTVCLPQSASSNARLTQKPLQTHRRPCVIGVPVAHQVDMTFTVTGAEEVRTRSPRFQGEKTEVQSLLGLGSPRRRP